MADKISDLDEAVTLADTDLFVIAQEDTANKKVTAETLADEVLAPPLDLQGTDPDEAVLTLRADPAQAEHILRVYNDAGDLAVDIDSVGRLDALGYIAQSPPDTGADDVGSAVVSPGRIAIAHTATTPEAQAFQYRRWRPVAENDQTVFMVNRTGSVLGLNPTSEEHVASIEIGASQDELGNAIELWDFPFNNMLFALSYLGALLSAALAPHPDLAASQFSIHLDDDDTSPALVITAKTADGSDATATIPLTPV